MPLNKEQMRIYMANRRARQRERGGIEGVKRAKDIVRPQPDSRVEKALRDYDDGKTLNNLPVPVLAEPGDCKNVSQRSEQSETTGEARDAQREQAKPSGSLQSDSRGGQESMTNTIETQPTKTDLLFENKKPGYYIFEREVQRDKDLRLKKCWYCGEEYETRMKLNKFCCPDHKERWLIQSFRMGKE